MEKRKKIVLTSEEAAILKWLYAKTLVPIAAIIVISSTVLFFGLGMLMQGTNFGNYGIAPGAISHGVSRFITIYLFIAVTNIILMIALSAQVMYLILQTIVMPIMRVTRQLRQSIESKEKVDISVRKTDKLIVPLVELIQKLL